MKNLLRCLAVGLALTSAAAFADDYYVGTIVATTTKNNADTAAPFTLPDAAKVAVQCDAAAYVRGVNTSAGTVTTSNGVKLAADQLYDIDLKTGYRWVAAVAVSGTANCRVFTRR